MNNDNQPNRRLMYRLEPPPVWAPILSIIVDGRRVRAATVIDVNLRGVRIALPQDDTLKLERGLTVTASIQAPGLDGCADIRGRVVFTADSGERRVVAVAFLDEPDLSDRTTADFFSVFNRRQEMRQAPAAGEVVEALVLDAAGQPDGVIDLTVLNQSAAGIGFVVDATTDAYMRDCAAVAISLAVPAEERETRAAHLRHRSSREDAVYYGCTLG